MTDREGLLQTLRWSPDAMSVNDLLKIFAEAGRMLSRNAAQRHLAALVDDGLARKVRGQEKYFALDFSPSVPSDTEWRAEILALLTEGGDKKRGPA